MAQLSIPQVAIAVTQEIKGVEMGVLGDGTPFLTGRSLAKVCGVVPSAVIKHANAWGDEARSGRLAQIITQHGYSAPELFIKTTHEGQEVHAYPDAVCMAFLEYYAFESNAESQVARNNYRLLARTSLRAFIYRALGYDPTAAVNNSWRQFHDRLLLNNAPAGFFSVFKEIAEVVLAGIKGGLRVDHHTVPDVSVGKTWSTYWKANRLEQKFGERRQHPHHYPSYFPQSAANVEACVYPMAALGTFRTWLQEVYIPEAFPRYLQNKVSSGAIEAASATLLLAQLAAD